MEIKEFANKTKRKILRKRKRVGTVHLHYYTDDKGVWDIRVAVGKNDLPDPETHMRDYIKMGLLTAQLAAYSKEQTLVLDTLLAIKEEAKKADVDKYQQPLPFTEEPG